MIEIEVLQENDGFEIVIKDYSNPAGRKRFRFNQEDTVEKLVDVFEELGFNCTFEEVY